MHSKIYQIERNQVSKEDFFNISYLEDPNTGQMNMEHYYDYINNDISKEERQDAIDDIEKLFPEGIIKKTGPNEFEKTNNTRQLEILNIKEINKYLSDLEESTYEKFYRIKEIAENPLKTDSLFIIEDSGLAERSLEFLGFINKLKVGDKFYVGAVWDYHY